jgi:hypothetical protein
MTYATTAPEYREAVPPARWFEAVIRLCALLPLIAAVGIVADEEATGAAWLGVAAFTAVSLALSVFIPQLLRLHIEVSRGQLRVRVGPFGRTIEGSAIRSARPERYRPWAFGGWGWRFGWSGGPIQAYSVPFLRSGVEVETSRGRYYLSSRTPARLAQAIERLAQQEGRI